MFRLSILFFFIFFLFNDLFLYAKVNIKLNFYDILKSIRGYDSFFKTTSYEFLLNFNKILIYNSKKNNIDVLDYLLADDKYRKNLSRSVVQGLFNKDPAIRLYCIYLLLKLKPFKDWVEIEIAMLLDSQSDYSETTDDFYDFHDFYLMPKKDTVKNALTKLFLSFDKVVLIEPNFNDENYKNSNFYFQWSELALASYYEFYINDVLYYNGSDSSVFIKQTFDFGKHFWTIVAKDKWDRIISSSSGSFSILGLSKPSVSLEIGNESLIFNWDAVEGASGYKILVKKKGQDFYKTAFTTNKTNAILALPIDSGDYFFILDAFNLYQSVVSDYVFVRSLGDKKPFLSLDK